MRQLNFIKEVSKEWRVDLNRWETIYKVFGYIKIYRYSVWGKRDKLRLFKISGAKYLPEMPDVKFRITNGQFKNEYNCNKYLLPLNMEVCE